jgi:predicted nucleotidyltransferase
MKFTYQGNIYKLILFTLAGSRFYGTHFDGKGTDREHPLKPDYISDSDFRGVFIANPDTKVGLTGSIEQIEVKKGKDGIVPKEQQELIKELNKKLGMNMPMDEDIALYEVRKFVSMAQEANPNIMDLLYADKESILYSNKKGRKLLKNRDIFLSKKTKYTFSGYAMAQIHKAKGHYKMLTKYPKVNTVIDQLRTALNDGVIDYNWITDHFGGDLSSYVTGITQEEASELGKIQTVSWEEFISTREANLEEFKKGALAADYSVEKELEMMNKLMFKGDWDNYRKPQMLDYVACKDLKAHKFKMDEIVDDIVSFNAPKKSIKRFLLEDASFRTISKTQFNIFTAPDEKYNGGIVARNGKIKSNEPKEVGEFAFQLSYNENDFKKDTDAIRKLWEWRTKRNEKRSILEEKFGYDTKHLSHTIRLLIGGQNILRTGNYEPRLTGDNLKLVRSILAGKYTYNEVVEMAEDAEKELNNLYDSCTLPHSADRVKANELLLKISKF